MTAINTPTSLQTASGIMFDLAAPRACDVFLPDIAHHLAHLCRWGGAVKHFYSVAQHSVLVSFLVPQRDALAGLLHDAAEAYVIDVPRPLKGMIPAYKDIEARVMAAISEQYGVPLVMPPSVKRADDAILSWEAHTLLRGGPRWDCGAPLELPDAALDFTHPMTPRAAKDAFLARARELKS